MPYYRPITLADNLSRCVPESVRECVAKALAEGKKVEWEHSTFTDPGGDYNKILVDGQAVYHESGY
jgi:hypothetical protein